MTETKLFDDWPDRYDRWFETPIGRLIKAYECELILELLEPSAGEKILDAGCGTGVFSRDVMARGVGLVGLELSLPMLLRARRNMGDLPFEAMAGDMRHLPFRDGAFDKAVSITAIEFIRDAKAAIDELFRVTRPGGAIVIATLNRLSAWADRRTAAGKRGHRVFRQVVFRSPQEVRALSGEAAVIKTAVHFRKDADPDRARAIEAQGRSKTPDKGAFLAARWEKSGAR